MKKIIFLSAIVTLISVGTFTYFEPEIISAAVDSDEIDVTLTVTSEITLTSPGNIAMSPALTMTQNTSIGTGTAWTVATNNAAGYKLELKSDEVNALKSASDAFTDYTAAVTTTPETWSVTSAYEFGFSVFGTDAPTATWGTDTDCIAAAGVPSAALKYRGFASTTQIQVATKATETAVAGVATTLCVAAEQNAVFAPSGAYTADVTGTATTL